MTLEDMLLPSNEETTNVWKRVLESSTAEVKILSAALRVSSSFEKLVGKLIKLTNKYNKGLSL